MIKEFMISSTRRVGRKGRWRTGRKTKAREGREGRKEKQTEERFSWLAYPSAGAEANHCGLRVWAFLTPSADISNSRLIGW